MKIKALTLAAVLAGAFTAQPALAQDDEVGTNGTTFRGIRVEGNVGVERFQSEGHHDDKNGFGGTVGFDGTLGSRFVIGAEGSFWTPGNGNENCSDLAAGDSICHKAFEEWGAAVRAGVLATPQLLVFGKAGYVNREQRKAIYDATGALLVYDHYRADGYQLGGGAEYTITQGRAPIYLNAQYVFSDYHGHSSSHRAAIGVGVRFK